MNLYRFWNYRHLFCEPWLYTFIVFREENLE
ncbi:MAG: hypothetical protein ACJAWX_002036 [Algoriphagus sp.]